MTSSDLLIYQAQASRTLADYVYYRSRFGHVNAHNGYRPSSIHTILASAGAGKTTLIRSILVDILSLNAKARVKVLLSEESVLDFLSEITRGENFITAERLDRTEIHSELDFDATSIQVLDRLEAHLLVGGFKFFIWDNLTTSKIYNNKTNSEQAAIVNRLKRIAIKTGCAIICVVHTNGDLIDASRRLIQPNDIRGDKTLVNASNFFYILQRFYIRDSVHMIISIHKHRGQDVDGRFFKLIYSDTFRIYTSDRPIGFDKVKEIYKERNVL